MSSSAARPKNWASIQQLRAIAALLVVFFHSRNPHDGLFNPMTHVIAPAHGVDIFFVISGFVMFTAARQERFDEFWRGRLVRIVPLYWLATAALAAMDMLMLGALEATPTSLVESLLLIPHYHPSFPDQIWPYLIPGWTLSYELFFYFVFSLSFQTRRPILLLTIVTGGLVLAGAAGSTDAVVRTFTSLRLLEFLAGVLIGRLALEDRIGLAIWALPAGAVGFFVSGALPLDESIRFAPAAVMIVLGAVAIEKRGWLRRVPLLTAIGDASYVTYLFHPIVLWILIDPFLRLPLRGWPQFIGFTLLAVTSSAGVGCLLHRWIERPLLDRLRRARGGAPAARHVGRVAMS